MLRLYRRQRSGLGFLEAGASKYLSIPSAAIAAAEPEDTVAIYPGQYFDCAVVPKSNVSVEAVGRAEQVVMN